MNIDSLRSFVALNTEIVGDQTVTFGDDAKQQIVGLNGNPRKFGDAAKLELDQNTILLKSQILTAVRDAVGTDQSEVFKNIESMLFGKLGKTGQFDPDKATKPLAMRDIQKVVKTLDKAGVGVPATIKGGADAQAVAKMGIKSLMTDTKAFLEQLNKNLDPKTHDRMGNRIGRNLNAALVNNDEYDGMPYRLRDIVEYDGLDLTLPGLGKKHYQGKNANNQLISDLSHTISGGKASTFQELSREDKRKLRLALACIMESGGWGNVEQATNLMFKNHIILQGGFAKPKSANISFNKDGSLSVSCSYRAKIASVAYSKDDINKLGSKTKSFNTGASSYVKHETTTTIPPDQVDKVSHLFVGLRDHLTCNVKISNFELNIEG